MKTICQKSVLWTFSALFAWMFWGLPVLAQEAPPGRGDPQWLLPLPEIEADPEIPTLKQVVGHDWAEKITSHSQVERYINALADSASERTRLVRYGASYEDRSLFYLVITSAENLTRLEAIRADILRLADPRTLEPDDAEDLVGKTPAVVWLAASVHGNETSSTDALLATAYSLLADRREETATLLRDLVVIIDPLQNPDGRERFLNAFREARGTFPEADRFGSEHTERWPGGRFNHYLFDMNRDWFIQTQQESRAKVAAYLDWQPQVYVDAHEMGSESTYYFDPPSDPVNSQITPTQRDWYMRIGRHHGAKFDEYGFAYTTREMFDAFYPGYGSTWPTMHGSIGILWEQAGVRGTVVDREDDTQLHYHDAVRHHAISALATLEASAEGKDELLLDFYRARASAIAEAPAHDYILLPGETPSRAARLARLLIDNGIEVRAIDEEMTLKTRGDGDDEAIDKTVPAGSYHVPAAQPAGRLVRTLLDRGDTLGEAFIERQLDRKARRLSDEIYDVTAWSLPLTFGVACLEASLEVSNAGRVLDQVEMGGGVEGPEAAKVGYLVSARDEASMLALADWLQHGYRVHVLDQPTTIGGRTFERGTLLLRTPENPESLHAAVRESARRFGLDVLGLDSSFVDEGAALGGPNVTWVKPPRVLMPVGDLVNSSVGHTWYLFDQVWRYPVTRVDGQYLSRTLDRNDHDVLILPQGTYGSSSALGESTLERIKQWVRGGGTLILVGSATGWAAGEKVGLIASEPRKRDVRPIPGEGLDPEPDPDTESPDDSEKADADEPPDTRPGAKKKSQDDEDKAPTESPDRVPGAFLRGSVYGDHWVTFGAPPEIDVLLGTGLILKPIKPTDGRNLVTFQAQDAPVSGFCWPQTLDLLKRTPYVVYQPLGRGHVVGFTDDPNFRALSPVTSRLFLNAVIFGPGH